MKPPFFLSPVLFTSLMLPVLAALLCVIGGPEAAAAPARPAPPRQTTLNAGWKFLRLEPTPAGDNTDPSMAAFDDTHWETVTLPHTAHVEPLVANNIWQGQCWYRKHVTVPAQWAGKKVAIDFGAAMSVAEVWVNGQPAAKHYGGYLPFSVDGTNALHPGDNVVAVRLDNRDNPEVPPGKPFKKLDFTWYSGLYRDVHLRVTDRLHITDAVQASIPGGGGVFVTYPEVTLPRATVKVQVHVVNEDVAARSCQVKFTLTDAQGKVAANITGVPESLAPGASHVFAQTLVVAHPALWSPAHPNLYRLSTSVVSGSAVIDAVQTPIGIRRIAISASGGFQINGQRLYLRGCNRAQEYAYLGYALSDNAQYRDALKIKQAGFDFVRLSHYPQSPAFIDACDQLGLLVMEPIPGWQFFGDALFQTRSVQDCRDMIRRDRNHPSIVMWETSLNETHMTVPFMAALQAAAHEEYPGGQCFTAGWQDNFDVFIQARQAGGCHNYHNGDKACLVSEYGDWEYYAGNAGLNQTAMRNLTPAERNSRQTRADGETRLLRQARNFQQAASDNRSTPAIGDAVWCMFDYSRGYASDLATCGTMDNLRLPKFSTYFFQSQRDASDSRVSGPMAHIASYWNEQSPTDVVVYSNCDEVSLSLNGKLVARQRPDTDSDSQHLPHPPFTFHLGAWTPGTLVATGYLDGVPKTTYSVTTPGKPVALRLRVDQSGRDFTADGADAVFVYADIVDAAGTVVSSAPVPVTLTVTGPARLVGDNPAPATGGMVGILLQSTGGVGTVKVEANAGTLRPAQLLLPARKP